eukprot:1869967-Amphidinium_carterae.3
MARADLCNKAWDLLLVPEKSDLLKEAQDLAGKGLLFWKGRGAVPPELAPCPCEEANEEEQPEEDADHIIGGEFVEDDGDEPDAAPTTGKAPLPQAQRLMALRLVYGLGPPH